MKTTQLQTGSTRDGFGEALLELGKTDPSVVVLSADLKDSMKLTAFSKNFPQRFFEIGVAEENMMGIAAGMALSGLTPFVCSYAAFGVYNALGPIRTSVCYSNLNVKIVGGHTGYSATQDGATHQALEDIACLRALPNMTIIAPLDKEEARAATLAAAQHRGPAYLRIGKQETATSTNQDFELLTASVLQTGNDLTIVGCGPLLANFLSTAKKYSADVINVHTIKPLDYATIRKSVLKTGKLLTLEDHQIIGGLGSAVAEQLVQNDPQLLKQPVQMLGSNNAFGESGSQQELLLKYSLDPLSIERVVQKMLH